MNPVPIEGSDVASEMEEICEHNHDDKHRIVDASENINPPQVAKPTLLIEPVANESNHYAGYGEEDKRVKAPFDSDAFIAYPS